MDTEYDTEGESLEAEGESLRRVVVTSGLVAVATINM